MSTLTGFDKIDHGMGQYYASKGNTDYFDENGIGKFKVYVTENDYPEDDIDEELEEGADGCGYVDFFGDDIDDFPFNDDDKEKDEDDKREIIFNKIKECYESKNISNASNRKNTASALQEINEDEEIEASDDMKDIEEASNIEQKSDKRPRGLKKMQTVLNLDRNHPDYDEDETQLSRACGAMQRYYHSFNRDYYKHLQKYVEDQGLMIEDELEQDPEESSIINFDIDAPFPFPSKLQNIEKSLKLRYKFDVIKKCYYCSDIIFDDAKENESYPKCLLSAMTGKQLYDITKEEFEKAVEIYKKQCPAIFHIGGMKSDNSLIYLAAMSLKYKFDYIQTMAKIYLRDRIDKRIDDEQGKTFGVVDFCGTLPHCIELKNMKISEPPWEIDEKQKNVKSPTNPGTAFEVLTHGIKSYGKRCVPYMTYMAPWAINDSLEITTRYIHAIIKFIQQTLNESNNLQKSVVPFQIDLVLCYTEPIATGIYYIL